MNQNSCSPPTFELLKPLFALLRAFAQKHDEILEAETRTWITEFMSVLAELGRSGKKEEPAATTDSRSQQQPQQQAPSPPPPQAPPPPTFGSIRLQIKDGDRVQDKLTVERNGITKEWDKGAQLVLSDIKPGEEPQFKIWGVIDGQKVMWIVPATKVTAGETAEVSVDPQQ